jgi:hypothetical protein
VRIICGGWLPRAAGLRMMVRPETGSSGKVGTTMSVDDLFAEAMTTNLSGPA